MTQTYEIVGEGQAIKCRICGSTSWNPGDVRHRFCGKCDQYHADMALFGGTPVPRQMYRTTDGWDLDVVTYTHDGFSPYRLSWETDDSVRDRLTAFLEGRLQPAARFSPLRWVWEWVFGASEEE